MKPRNPEAQRLEEDYLARVRAALAGRPAEEVAEVLQSIREHIEESAGAPTGMITLSEMARIVELLGPPAAYLADAVEPGTDARRADGPTLPPTNDYVHQPFELGSLIGDATNLFTLNLVPLLLASLIYHLLSVCSLGILIGPLAGGIVLMTLNAIHRPDHKVDIGDMFRLFKRFWPLLGLCLLASIIEFAGLLMCIVPGLLVLTVWGYSYYYMVDKEMGIVDSLRASYALVTAPGKFFLNFILAIIPLAILIAAGTIPYVGQVISLAVEPLLWFIGGLAFVRQARHGEAPASAAPDLSSKPAIA